MGENKKEVIGFLPQTN